MSDRGNGIIYGRRAGLGLWAGFTLIGDIQPVREAVSYRGLFIADWFGVREKHCSQLEIYDRLRTREQAVD